MTSRVTIAKYRFALFQNRGGYPESGGSPSEIAIVRHITKPGDLRRMELFTVPRYIVPIFFWQAASRFFATTSFGIRFEVVEYECGQMGPMWSFSL